jgi:hypothetical protein
MSMTNVFGVMSQPASKTAVMLLLTFAVAPGMIPALSRARVLFGVRGNDFQSALRRWLLQALCEIPRRTHPHLPLVFRQQQHGRGVGMNGRNVKAGLSGQKAEEQVLSGCRLGVGAALALPFPPDAGKEHHRPGFVLGEPCPDGAPALAIVRGDLMSGQPKQSGEFRCGSELCE